MKQSIIAKISLLLGIAFFVLPAATPVEGADGPRTAAEADTAVGPGIIEGTVKFRGAVPKARIPDDAGLRHDLLTVDPESKGLQYVVVWLAMDGVDAKPGTPDAKPALVDQINHQFVPRVLAVLAGQPVSFTNSDAANHNVRTGSSRRANEFNVYTGANGSYTHRFAADPRHTPVQLGCDIHPWMRGWIYVFDHPWFAVTDRHGDFRIGSIPPGDYTLVIQQPDIPYKHERKITVFSSTATNVVLEIQAENLSKAGEPPATKL